MSWVIRTTVPGWISTVATYLSPQRNYIAILPQTEDSDSPKQEKGKKGLRRMHAKRMTRPSGKYTNA
jgi:hypothetical protein